MTKRRTAKAVRRTAALSVAAVLVGLPVIASGNVSALPSVTTDRIGGADRYETAVEISERAFPAGNLTDIILATGENFPDALAGASAAGTVGGPILLTPAGGVPDSVLAEIARLTRQNPEETTVHILGGEAAVSADVADAVAATGVNVVRHEGANRYDTAVQIALWVDSQTTIPNVYDHPGAAKTVFVATGENFPDALAAGPLAFDGPHPVILVPGSASSVPDNIRHALEDMSVNEIVLLGGEAAVSADIESELESIIMPNAVEPDPVHRVAGDNRYATAAAVADLAVSNAFDFDGAQVLLASGSVFPDALAGGPLGGKQHYEAPILLVQDGAGVPAATTAWLQDHNSTVNKVIALGGTARISEETLDDARHAAQSVAPNHMWTHAPELRNVNVMDGHDNVLEYHFDEDVPGQPADVNNLRVYNACGQYIEPEVAAIFGANVRADFGRNLTGSNPATVAVAQYDAVEDEQGVPNIEGSYPLTDPPTTLFLDGHVQLIQVDNYMLQGDLNPGGTQEISIDFTFSGPIPNLDPAAYFMLLNEGGFSPALTTPTPAYNLVVVAPNVARVFFNDGVSNLPEAQLKRGVVTLPEGGFDYLLSERYFMGDGLTVDPDLVSAVRVGANQIRYTFDEAVGADQLDPGNFGAFDLNGNAYYGTVAQRVAAVGEGARQVLVTFEEGLPSPANACDPEANPLTDAFVFFAAAQATDNTNTDFDGYNGEAQVSLTTESTTIVGQTILPELVRVDRTQDPVTEDYAITFTFDQPCGAQGIYFDLYDVNGTQRRYTGSCDGDSSVTFTSDSTGGVFTNDWIAAAVVAGVENADAPDEVLRWNNDAQVVTGSVRVNF